MTESLKFNDVGDILYVRLRNGKVANTKAFGDDRLVDLDENRTMLGVEFIGIDREIDIRGLPEQSRLRDALLVSALRDFVILHGRGDESPESLSQHQISTQMPTNLPFSFQRREPVVNTLGGAVLANPD